MTALDVWLVALLVALASIIVIAGVVGIWLAIVALVKYARYELDAGERALKMQALINDRVEQRLARVRLVRPGDSVSSATGEAVIPEQPPDPGVHTRSVVDELHEIERETSRVIDPDATFDKRDTFAAQPLAVEM